MNTFINMFTNVNTILHIFIEFEYHIFYIDEYSTIFVDEITLYIYERGTVRTKRYDICYDDKPISPKDDINRKNIMDMFFESSEEKYNDIDADVRSIESNWVWKNDGYIFNDVMDIIENFYKNKCIIFYTFEAIILQRVLARRGINGTLSSDFEWNIPCVEIDDEIDEMNFEFHIKTDKSLYLFPVVIDGSVEYTFTL